MTISPNGRKTGWQKRKEQTTVSIVECHIFQVCTRLRSNYSSAGNCTVSYVHSYQVQNNLFANKLFSFFAATMAWSGFGPYHCMWREYAQTKCICAILTPWAMMIALGLGAIMPRLSSITHMFFFALLLFYAVILMIDAMIINNSMISSPLN